MDSQMIPPMTDPMGRYWHQPAPENILVDATHTLMTSATFAGLAEYSASVPSGIYPGKMWKRHDGAFDRAFRSRGGLPVWRLCWYGPSKKGPDYCSVNSRVILLTDAELPHAL